MTDDKKLIRKEETTYSTDAKGVVWVKTITTKYKGDDYQTSSTSYPLVESV